jgi:hypothetical protein
VNPRTAARVAWWREAGDAGLSGNAGDAGEAGDAGVAPTGGVTRGTPATYDNPSGDHPTFSATRRGRMADGAQIAPVSDGDDRTLQLKDRADFADEAAVVVSQLG